MWVNTREFQPVALGKEQIPDKNSTEYLPFVSQEIRRCTDGYTVGDKRITGAHYWFLNHYLIYDKKKAQNVVPMFLDFQADFFALVEECKNSGIGLAGTKRRQIGVSNMFVALAICEGYFREASKTLICAEGSEQLDAIWDMIINTMNEVSNGIFAYGFRRKTNDVRQLGVYNSQTGTYLGKQSIWQSVNYAASTSMKSVGATPTLLIIDEAGKAKGLLNFFNFVRPGLRDDFNGGVYSGVPIIFGVTGEMEQSAGLRTLMYNPVAYGLKAFKYDDESVETGLLFEGWRQLVVDKDGNCDKEKGVAIILERRKQAESIKDNGATMLIEITQYPLTLKEAFLSNKSSHFNQLEIKDQLEACASIPLVQGNFSESDGEVIFVPSKDGRFKMHELPCAAILPGRYIGGVDPINLDKGTSLASMYVFKRLIGDDGEPGNYPVLEYLGRPRDTMQFSRDVLLAARFYNAVMMVETSNNMIKDYFYMQGELARLAKKPRMDKWNKPKEVQSVTYGCNMTQDIKLYALELCQVYMKENVSKVAFPALLTELLTFNFDDNFDAVMAFFQVMIYKADLWKRIAQPATKATKKTFSTWERDKYGRPIKSEE
jgi:hypothetical protein